MQKQEGLSVLKDKQKLPKYPTGTIDTFCDFPVTTSDKCIECKQYFTFADKGNIDAYKPWMRGDFWHIKCPTMEKEFGIKDIYTNNRTRKENCISSICEDNNHILFWDFDNMEKEFVLKSLSQIQDYHKLGDIYIIKSLHGYNALCFDKFFLNHVHNILFYTRWNDFNHVRVGFKYESWCLKLSPNKKIIMRLIPTENYIATEQSNAHFQFFKKFFNFNGLRIIVPDKYKDIQFESYKQNRC